MKCLVGVSKYGVILLNDDNEIEWEYRIDGRIYGLDYSDGKILIGLNDELLITTKNKLYTYKIPLPNSNIHSCFFEGKKILVTLTKQDKVLIITKRGDTLVEWKAEDWFAKPDKIEGDWTHLNYFRNTKNGYLISLYSNPITRGKGFILHLYDFKSAPTIIGLDVLNAPHAAVSVEGGILVADSGNNRIVKLNYLDEVVWEYIPEPLEPLDMTSSERPEVKYGHGATFLEMLDENRFVCVLYNHRVIRIINWNKEIEKEWKIPEHIYEGKGIGEDPRPFQCKVIE